MRWCPLLAVLACAHPRADPASAPASPRPEPTAWVLAVFDLADATGAVAEGERRQLGDYLAVRLATLPATRVLPRDQLREALREAKADGYRACFDQSCQIELGKALSADRSASPQLLRVGSRCALTVALYDLRTEASERAASTQTECAADALFGAVDELVRQLGGAAPAVAPLGVRAVVELRPSAPAPSAPRAEVGPPMELRLSGDPDPSAVAAPPPSAAPTASRVVVRARGGRRVLELSPSVSFAREADQPTAEARRALELAAAAILADPSLRALRLEVVGYAEAGERGRLELSERRARAARTVLVASGLELARLAVVGAGEGAGRQVELRLAED